MYAYAGLHNVFGQVTVVIQTQIQAVVDMRGNNHVADAAVSGRWRRAVSRRVSRLIRNSVDCVRVPTAVTMILVLVLLVDPGVVSACSLSRAEKPPSKGN